MDKAFYKLAVAFIFAVGMIFLYHLALNKGIVIPDCIFWPIYGGVTILILFFYNPGRRKDKCPEK